jgi:hypothetical protein
MPRSLQARPEAAGAVGGAVVGSEGELARFDLVRLGTGLDHRFGLLAAAAQVEPPGGDLARAAQFAIAFS